MKRISALVVGVLGLAAVAACQPGQAEKSGEKADSAYEETVNGQKDLTDGPLENAGEAVDKAAADTREAASDAGNAIEKKADEVTKDDPKK